MEQHGWAQPYIVCTEDERGANQYIGHVYGMPVYSTNQDTADSGMTATVRHLQVCVFSLPDPFRVSIGKLGSLRIISSLVLVTLPNLKYPMKF